MNTTKHTPGPWHYSCGAVWTAPYGEGGICIAKRDSDAPLYPTEKDANMRFIAAAPAMYEALQLAQATIKRLSTQHGPFNSAQGTLDVIAKALSQIDKP